MTKVEQAEPAQSMPPDMLRQLVDEPLSLEQVVDPARVVPAIPPQTFVRLARLLREESRLDLLLPFATPDQLTCLIDLDAWRQDRVDLPRAREWLAEIAEHYTSDLHPRGTLSKTIFAMDPEMWTLAVADGTLVMEINPEEDDSRDAAYAQMNGRCAYETPDAEFIVGVSDDQHGQTARRILDRVYADDLRTGRRLVASVSSASGTLIEEELLRWRAGRLADMGFVAWEDAAKLFRPFDRNAALAEPARDFAFLRNVEGPVDFIEPWRSASLLKQVMDRLDEHEHGVRSREFLLLVNEVMAAQRFDAGDERLQQRAIDQTQATIGLGLEMLAAARPEHPEPLALLAERVHALGLRDVFRVGYGALDRLRRACVALHRAGRVSLQRVGSLLDRPWGPALAALVRWYPELPVPSTSAGLRPLRSLQDVALATALIAQAGALAALTFERAGYGVDPIWIGRVDDPERLTLGDLLRSAVIAGSRGRNEDEQLPLVGEDLVWARDNLLSGGRLIAKVREELAAKCEALGIAAHAEVLADTLLPRIEVELATLEWLPDGGVDLTKVGSLLTVQHVGMWLKITTGDRASDIVNDDDASDDAQDDGDGEDLDSESSGTGYSHDA